jgi:hypothetical protein
MDQEKPKRKIRKWEPDPKRDLTATIRSIMETIKSQAKELETRSLIDRVKKN